MARFNVLYGLPQGLFIRAIHNTTILVFSVKYTMRSRVDWWPRCTHTRSVLSSLFPMSSNPTSKNSFFDLFKPRYHEATFRLKNSLIASIALLTLTHLLPLPTLYTSAWKFYRNSFHSSWEKSLAIAGTIPQRFFFLSLIVTPCASIRAISLLPTHSQHPPSSHCDSLTPSALPASPLARLQIPVHLILARAPLEAGPAAGDYNASMA